MRRTELGLWIAVAVVLAGLAVPWFLWGSGTVVASLPVWLWWHVGWMGLASIVFWVFTRRAWGIGIDRTGPDSSATPPGAADGTRKTNSRGESP
ncbi:DUF3311 domain-containing protein [Natrinema caseinilyticum]|uniref:DUF3311 domain-containing protein n=1 Tax=Natrinema caseinilyticum TaxID=2961570 RepID=UPI0020C277BA|nr:DUF3311 domain-containing protein [Natrinema caseinilyticum]